MLFFEKFADFDRINEPVGVSIPFKQGAVKPEDIKKFTICDENKTVPTQVKALGYWRDGSVKWLKADFLADIPANKNKNYFYEFSGNKTAETKLKLTKQNDFIKIENGLLDIELNNKPGAVLFKSLRLNDFLINETQIDGPYYINGDNKKYTALLSEWKVLNEGCVRVELAAEGKHGELDYILYLTVYAGTPWIELRYKIINKHDDEYINIKKIALDIHINGGSRTLATSNYNSEIKTGDELYYMIDADHLIYEANEQIPEVFYGTFFADWNNNTTGGLCATIYQAYQNFPKALRVNKDLLSIEILPEEYGQIKFYKGMAKTHTIFLHLHDPKESIEAINKRSLMLQCTDRPVLPSSVYEESGIYGKIFTENKIAEVETSITGMMDGRGKAYGFLHWGDFPDEGYSLQGRGKGEPVWTNNEYDFPYAAMQMYARKPERRFADYMLVSAAHWIDIDVCHHDPNPLRLGGQIIHSAEHITGVVDISHEWVEGLFSYYYFTGDKFAYDTAIETGHNIVRNLNEPRFKKKGQINARETGWALRSLVALYRETNDASWLDKADFIVSHFEDWKSTYGGWFAPYTGHTVIRVPFMISIAAASLMRYYQIKPDEKIKNMIVDAVDDLIENCLLESGLFYYKELPSLRVQGGNTIVLEALSYAYELTGDVKYIKAGIPTFNLFIKGKGAGNRGGGKRKTKDGVLMGSGGSKAIAQSFYPVMIFYYYISKLGLSDI